MATMKTSRAFPRGNTRTSTFSILGLVLLGSIMISTTEARGSQLTLHDPRLKLGFKEALNQYHNDLLLTSGTSDTSCIRLLQNVTNYFLDNNETVSRIFRNSGKDYNDLGRYEDCLNLTNYNYILATVPKAFPIPMSLGICVPSVCKVQDFNAFRAYLVQMVNQLIPELFTGIKGFDLHLQLSTEDMSFEDSYTLNRKVTEADGWGWVIVLGVLFFVLSVILASVAQWYFKKE